MKHDLLKQYVALRESLEQERAEVQARLTEMGEGEGGEEAQVDLEGPDVG